MEDGVALNRYGKDLGYSMFGGKIKSSILNIVNFKMPVKHQYRDVK